jgi:outer membrane protein TolC
MQTGCQGPSQHRIEADKAAGDIIQKAQKLALGKTGQFDIERPSDILRRRLLIEQELPYTSASSLGTDKLKPIEYWPEDNYPTEKPPIDPFIILDKHRRPKLSLLDVLQIGARNSFEYQSLKEDVFRFALELDLQRNEFRNIFAGQVESLLSTDATGGKTVSGAENGAAAGLSRRFENGVELTAALAVDLAKLLTSNGASSLGIAGDATIAVPLLRGSGRHIVREPLTQAERDVVYAVYAFERFKQTFAVEIATEYFGVLRRLDQVENAEENYKSLMKSARRSRRMAEAGRMSAIQLDQGVQRELRARDDWISAVESYKRGLDSFKNVLGLPPDADVELDTADLEQLVGPASKIMADIVGEEEPQASEQTPPADAPVELIAPSAEDAGPLEIDESLAIELALDNRVDLRVVEGQVYDAQRAVVVAADALGAELTLFGDAGLGGRRSIASASADDARLRADRGKYSALFTLDLPLERTAERNDYRNSLILLERAVRNVQILEDRVKLTIRNQLRDMLESRESLNIQAQSVLVAERRVKSTELFLEAGKQQTQIRDLLEAQDALLSAQNRLTFAAVSYRIAELELQSDMGLLRVNEKGLFQEYSPEEINDVKE